MNDEYFMKKAIALAAAAVAHGNEPFGAVKLHPDHSAAAHKARLAAGVHGVLPQVGDACLGAEFSD